MPWWVVGGMGLAVGLAVGLSINDGYYAPPGPPELPVGDDTTDAARAPAPG